MGHALKSPWGCLSAAYKVWIQHHSFPPKPRLSVVLWAMLSHPVQWSPLLFLRVTLGGQADWQVSVLSCSFQWRAPLQPLLCQCIAARGSVCKHVGDAGALPGCRHPSCDSQMVPSDGRGDLRCPRDPPRPSQRHSPDFPLPSFKLQHLNPWQYLLLHSWKPFREN